MKGISDENENTLFSGVKQLLLNCGVLNSRNELKIFRWYNLKSNIKKVIPL